MSESQSTPAKKMRVPNIRWKSLACASIPAIMHHLRGMAAAAKGIGIMLEEAGQHEAAQEYYQFADSLRDEADEGAQHLEDGDCVQ